MDILVLLSLVVWGTLIILFAFLGSVQFAGGEVQSVFGRVLVVIALILIIGLVFRVLGVIGEFLLLPISALLQ